MTTLSFQKKELWLVIPRNWQEGAITFLFSTFRCIETISQQTVSPQTNTFVQNGKLEIWEMAISRAKFVCCMQVLELARFGGWVSSRKRPIKGKWNAKLLSAEYMKLFKQINKWLLIEKDCERGFSSKEKLNTSVKLSLSKILNWRRGGNSHHFKWFFTFVGNLVSSLS